MLFRSSAPRPLGLYARALGAEAYRDRAVEIGAHDPRSGGAVALEHLAARMAEAVAIADGEHRLARRDRARARRAQPVPMKLIGVSSLDELEPKHAKFLTTNQGLGKIPN